MCGIAGYFQIKPSNGSGADDLKNVAQNMGDCIAHRGPDDHDIWIEPSEKKLALIHRRLSIIDLSQAGHQPMKSHSGRYVIVYNGEIFNFKTLSAELVQLGHKFNGHSDTEVLLAAIEQWGIESTLKRLVGMFAFALYDQKNKELTLARDRLGQKPLYFGWGADGSAFGFSSELKSFLKTPGFQKPEINRHAVDLYLQWRYVPDPYSIYKNIWKLPPSSFITLPLEKFQSAFDPQDFVQSYWDFENIVDQDRDFNDENAALDELENVLTTAVSERMIADVPLGAFLSGGVDSSLIVALMQKQSATPISSFTIAFENPRFNEAQQAAEISKHLGTHHTEMLLTADEALNTVTHMAEIFDEPLGDPSCIPTYHVCRLARKNMTVALSGDGGDESFGGYDLYTRTQKLLSLMQIPRPIRKIGASLLRNMPMPGQRFSPAQRKKLAALISAKCPDELYPLIHSYWFAVTGEALPAQDNTPYDNLRRSLKTQNPVERMMAFDARMFLTGDVLAKVDRCSMAHSLEVRSPLLDHRVIEHSWRMPLSMKISNGTKKYALKQLLRRHLPDEFIDRPKMGFGIPHGQWLRENLSEWADDLLSKDALLKHGFIVPEYVRPYWIAHKNGDADYGHYLWTVVCLQNWAEHWR